MTIYLEPNNLFYFYSTLAQSVAALIAFLGVFIVFRMQYLDNIISNLDRALDNNITHIFHEEFTGEIDLYNKVEKILKKHEVQNYRPNDIKEAREIIANCKDLRKEKNRIRKFFIWPTGISILTIITSIIGILLVDSNNEHICSIPATLLLSISLAIISIVLMFVLLFITLKSEKSTR